MPALARKPHRRPAQSKALEQWLKLLDTLFNDITAWVNAEQWPLGEQHTTIQEEGLGQYQVRVLNIKTPNGILIVEPIAHSVIGAQGRVDLYAFPSLNRARMLWTGKKWIVRTDSDAQLRQTWCKKTFIDLAQDLTKAP